LAADIVGGPLGHALEDFAAAYYIGPFRGSTNRRRYQRRDRKHGQRHSERRQNSIW
jgi:hypothetical protein